MLERTGDARDRCPPRRVSDCAQEWESLRLTQRRWRSWPVASHVTCCCVSVWREPGARSQPSDHRQCLALAWKNTVGPFLLHASAGFASAVLLLGTVTLLVTMFTQPETAQANTDEPLGNPTAPHLVRLSTGAGNGDVAAISGQVVVEAYINDEGEVYDFRIVSAPTMPQPSARLRTCCFSASLSRPLLRPAGPRPRGTLLLRSLSARLKGSEPAAGRPVSYRVEYEFSGIAGKPLQCEANLK